MTECGGGVARAVGSSGNGRRRQPSQCQVHRWICSLLLRARKDDGDAAPGAPFLPREKEKWKHPSPKPSRKCGLRNTHAAETRRREINGERLFCPSIFLRGADGTSFFASLSGGARAAARSGPVMCEWTCIKVMPCMFYVLHTGNSRNAVP